MTVGDTAQIRRNKERIGMPDVTWYLIESPENPELTGWITAAERREIDALRAGKELAPLRVLRTKTV